MGKTDVGVPTSHLDDSNSRPSSTYAVDPEKEINDSPIEEVRLTVPITDDPSQRCLTFRAWVLGLSSCIILSFLNQFFGYRNNMVSVSSVCAQLLSLPVGRFMAATLPTRYMRVPLTNWSFTLNPGPFNLKEHALITIMASSGGSVYALNIVTILPVFYHKSINFVAALLLALSTQMLGYGWAGIFRKYLVDSPYMWWPSNLVQVSLFRALHEDEKRPKGGMTRLQFFLASIIVSFAYYVVPGYFFPSITALSFVCWIWKNSVTAQIIGSGNQGLGLGSFALDWSTITMFGNPIAVPAFAIINVLVGYVFVIFVLLPVSYWTNTYNAKRFPILSSHVYDYNGLGYNTTRVLNDATFSIDYDAYNSYSKINLSIFWVYTYGLGFGMLTSTLSHVAVFNGKTIVQLWKQTAASSSKGGDVHSRLMKNYEQVPQWWFQAVLVIFMVLSIITCEGFGKQLQLPYWGIFLACAIAFVFTLPVGVIVATTSQGTGLNVITELIIGYLYPGKPLANVTFKTYGSMSMGQAISFLSDFKLGHYMKIPPKSMFWAQFVGTLVGTLFTFGTAWWLLTGIPNICDVAKLPVGSPWTCPGYDVFYNASIIWGVVGPLRMFGPLGLYPEMNYFFLIGFLLPVFIWYAARIFPKQKWIRLINIPIMMSATAGLPVAKPAAAMPWFILALFFNVYVYKRHKGWWARHAYVMSAGLDAGIAFFAILVFFTLQNRNINGVQWWGMELDDHCPLAKCPTAPGIVIEGCPVF